jgi:hypothetical protein
MHRPYDAAAHEPIQSNEADMARLIWRKQNLASFRIAELAKARHGQIIRKHVPEPDLYFSDGMEPAERALPL